MKIYILLTFIYILGIYSDFLNDDYYDIMNCIGTDTNKCSSTKLKTKDLECCLFDVTYLDSSYEDEDEDAKICSAVFTTYVFKV